MNWSEFAALYLRHSRENKKPNTYRNFDFPAVSSFQFDGELVAVAGLHIESWKSTLHQKGYNKNNVAIMWTALRSAFGYAVKLKLIPASPFDGLPRPEREDVGRYLTEHERGQLLRNAREPLRSAMVFALNTGMRISEILALDWRQVRDGVVVIEKRNRKGKTRSLQMPLNVEALSVMGQPQPSGAVFPFKARTIQDQLLGLWRALDLGRIRFHDLRHTFVTDYLKHGSTRDLVEMGTHASENGLRGYNHPPNELLHSRMGKLHGGGLQKQEPQPGNAAWWGSASSVPTYANLELMRRKGLEPLRPFGHTPLKRTRLPVPPPNERIYWDGVVEEPQDEP